MPIRNFFSCVKSLTSKTYLSVRASIPSPKSLLFLLVSLHLASLLTYNYYSRIEAPTLAKRIALHTSIVSGTAPYQYRYRVLIPFLVDTVARVFDGVTVPRAASRSCSELPYSKATFALAYMVSNFLAFFTLFLCLTALVNHFFGFLFSLIAAFLTAVLLEFTFRDHYFHPWSLWEGALFAAGLLLVHRQRYRLFIALATLGAFNRETSVFLPLGFLFYKLPRNFRSSAFALIALWRNRELRGAFTGIACWLIAFFLVHHFVGYSPATFTPEMAWQNNRRLFPYTLLLNGLLFGPFLFLLPHGLRNSPFLIQRFSLIIPLYLLLLFYLGHWWEIRYWISVFPILIPAMVASMAAFHREGR